MITLLAATGFTGQLTAHALYRLGVPFRLAARDESKLRELSARTGHPPFVTADVTRPETLGRIFDDTRVLITCAGPFTELGEPVVAEAARRGIHYLDTTGEQHFIKRVFDGYSQIAAAKNAALVSGAAFEYALGDAAAAIAARDFETCDEINISYFVEGFGTSRGTKKSILHSLSSPGFLWRDGRLIPSRAAAVQKKITLPDGRRINAFSFAAGEIIQVPTHISTRAITTLMVMDSPAAALVPTGARLLSALFRSPAGNFIRRKIDSGSFGPSPEQRDQCAFTIQCEARSGSESRTVTVQGHDPYGQTAVIISALAQHLLEKGTENVGAIAPSSVAGEQLIVKATETSGVRWKRET